MAHDENTTGGCPQEMDGKVMLALATAAHVRKQKPPWLELLHMRENGLLGV